MAEKGIRTVWIDSDSVGVLGTKVYRDDVLIATVPFGTQFYNDPTAVIGVNYKYEVQAYNSTSESTDEVLGTNISYYTIQSGTNLKPIMTSFRVEDATPNLVHFSTPLGSADGIDFNDFTIEGKEITAVNTADNYFTLSADLDFWDNILIKKEGGDNSVVYDFTLQNIGNNINEPITTITKWAAPTTQGTGSGDDEANAWSYSTAGSSATAGTLVKMLAGTQSTSLVISVSGNVDAPIVFEGYNNAAKDVLVTRTPGLVFDDTIMPLISNANLNVAGSGTSNYRSNIILRNIQVQPNDADTDGITIDYNHNMLLDNVYVTEAKNGLFALFSHQVFNIRMNRVFTSNCSNAGLSMPIIASLLNDVYAASSYDKNMDYYLLFNGVEPTVRCDSVIKDCYVERFPTDSHPGHGISLKANSSATTDREVEGMLVIDSSVKNTEMSIELRHTKVQYNVVRNVSVSYDEAATATRNIGGVQVTSGRNNIVENCDFDIEWGVRFLTSSEDLAATDAGNNNTFRNNVFRNSHTEYGNFVVWFYADSVAGENPPNDNKWINNTFDNFDYMNYNSVTGIGTGNIMTNNIINDVVTEIGGSGAIVNTYTNNLFWDTWGGNSGEGTGAITTINPDLDANFQPQATFADIDVPRIEGVYYDKNGNERQDQTTVGSVLSAEEVSVTFAPTLVSVTIENAAPSNVVMVFDQPITMTNLVSNGFTFNTVVYNGVSPESFISISGSGTTWTGVIATDAIYNKTYRLDYSSTTGDVSNTSGDGLETFIGASVTNNTESSEDNFVGSASIYTPQVGGSVVYLDINAADDTGDGSIGNPYKDIEVTIGSGSSTRVTAGDVLVMRGGTYPTELRLSNQANRDTEAERIVIQNYPGETVIIDGTNVVWAQPDNDQYQEGVFSLYNTRNYDILDGIQIHNSQKAGIYFSAHNANVLNCRTYHTGASGIYMGSATNALIDNNEIELGTYLGDQEMITAYGCENVVISNNRIHHGGNENEHQNGLGIDVKNGGTNIEIVGNKIYDIRSHAIYLDSRVTGNGFATNGLYIHGNECYNIESNGIQIATEVWVLGEPVANNIRIYNNIIHDLDSTAIRIGYASNNWNYFYDMQVVNNTIYNIGNTGIAYDLNADGNHTANNVKISNNILRATGTEDPAAFFPIYKASTDAGVDIVVDTNILDRDIGDTGINYTIADPLFIDEDNADFHLQDGSPAIDTGIESVDIYQPTTDYDGNPRVVNSIIDMGAFEKQ